MTASARLLRIYERVILVAISVLGLMYLALLASFSFPGGYLMAGLAVTAIALAFRIGERMQRDTEGLV